MNCFFFPRDDAFITKNSTFVLRSGLFFLVGVFFLLVPDILFAQQSEGEPADTLRPVERDIERFLEDFDPDDDEIDPDEFTQFLLDLASNPLNLNTASLNELLSLPGLNARQAQAIIAYRSTKPFETIDELTAVSGIGPTTLERVRPYVTLGPRGALTRQLILSPGFWTQQGRFEFISRAQTVIERQAGFRPPDFEGQTRYAGNSLRYYQRMNYRSRHLSLNLTQVKLPGEELSGINGFDFNSWHVGLRNVGMLRQLVVGDYGVWAGQGLVLFTGLGFGKGRDVVGSPSRNERGAVPYQSSEQTRFMRGVAATVGGNLQFTGFYSSRRLSASVVQGDSVRLPSSTGFHRTPSEIARRNNTVLEMYGGRITYSMPVGLVGATGYVAEYDKYIVPATALHNRYDFEGRIASVTGVDYRLFFGPVILFGEGARSRNGGLAMIGGSRFPVGDVTDVSVVYRNYGKDFQSVFGSGFGEQSGRPRNEEGLYVGIRHRLSPMVRLSGYFDQFRFPAPRFGTRQSTMGYDVLGLAEFRFSRELSLYVLARSKVRENDYLIRDEFNREINVLGQDARTSVRTELEYMVNPRLRARTRFELVRARDRDETETENGVMIFQDLRWLPANNLTIDLRLAVFETDGFTSRIFAYENDLLGTFSNAVFSGTGQRAYILARYAPNSRIDIWLKYGATVYEDRQTVGSGLDESAGNIRSQLGAQARIRF
ncbi:MAG: helix-hairpin-helix domain-containing protein [Balneolales bacterium]|nr:helix-hairpin-helix domain-containing protein [Balneolales bacterium]